MAEVVLFHHVQGLTDGVRAFAAELRAGGARGTAVRGVHPDHWRVGVRALAGGCPGADPRRRQGPVLRA
jgi:hypothetical protein